MKQEETRLLLPEEPAALETRYRAARAAGEAGRFHEALEDRLRQDPDNVLLQAWHFRLVPDEAADPPASSRSWIPAILLSLLCGLTFWSLSGGPLPGFGNEPALVYLWAPVTAVFVLAFLVWRDPGRRRGALIAVGTLALLTFALVSADRLDLRYADQYRVLLLIHLPLLSWAAVGLSLTAWPTEPAVQDEARFRFIRKSLEVMVTGGLYLAAGMVFAGITVGLFEALDVRLSEEVIRFLAAGGAGLLPVLAVASVYDPDLPPQRQALGQGVGRLVPIVTRLLLPLALAVLAIYIVLIPFNFDAPFRNREVLIVYNIMLFAVTALLIGVAPVGADETTAEIRLWLRRGVVILAAAAALVGLYALAAVVTRTLAGGWTLNRVTVIGWNVVHLGLLALVVHATVRGGAEAWPATLRTAFARGAGLYLVWTLALLALLPAFGTLLK